jgi:SagB-type dehydrogenase family enzyme
MASVQPYVIAAGIDGLPAGIPFFYDSYDHELIGTGDHTIDTRDLAEIFPEPATVPPALFITLTAGLEVARAKYQDFSLKLTFMDGGCAITQCRRLAHGYGIRADVVGEWTAALVAELLGIDLMSEPIMGVLRVVPA